MLSITKFNFFIIVLCFLSACNTGYQSGYTGQGAPVQLKVEAEPSKSTIKGECLADTLSFLVGQPETALAAMEYPANTRVFSEGQEVDVLVLDVDRGRIKLSMKELLKGNEEEEQIGDDEASLDDEIGDHQEVS